MLLYVFHSSCIATAQPTNSATVHIYKSAMLWEEHTSPTEASDMQDDI